MNREELLKELQSAKDQMSKLQSIIDKTNNMIESITDDTPKKEEEITEFYIPKHNEEYFTITNRNKVSKTKWSGDGCDSTNLVINNVFRTEKECNIEKELLLLFAEIKQLALERGELIPKKDVLNPDVEKYYLVYDISYDAVYCAGHSYSFRQGIIPNCWFKTAEFSEEVIQKYGNKISHLLNKKYKEGTE